MAEIVRPLPSAGFAFHAAGAMLSIRYWLMRLLVSKALSKAVGSWLAKAGLSLSPTGSGELRFVVFGISVSDLAKAFNLA